MIKQRLSALLAIVLCAGFAVSCGSAPKRAGDTVAKVETSSGKAPGYREGRKIDWDGDSDGARNDTDGDEDGVRNDGDGDGDGGVHGRLDRDDAAIVHFGHAASASERQAIDAVVARYYKYGAEDNGAASCAITDPLVAMAIVEDLASPAGGVPALRGLKTCAAVRTRLFQYTRAEFIAPIRIIAVHVRGRRANVFLVSSKMPMRLIQVKRDRGVWTIDRFDGDGLP